MDSGELVFGAADPFVILLFVTALAAGAYWSFAVGSLQRGRHRQWTRDPALGGPKLTSLLPPYREDWTRGLTFMRWWAALLLPALLCMPAVLAFYFTLLDRRMSFLDAAGFSFLIGLGFGSVLLILKSSAHLRQKGELGDAD